MNLTDADKQALLRDMRKPATGDTGTGSQDQLTTIDNLVPRSGPSQLLSPAERWKVRHQADRAYDRWIASGRTDPVAHAEASQCYDAFFRASSLPADVQFVALLDLCRSPGSTTQDERLALVTRVAELCAAETAHMVAVCEAGLAEYRRTAA